MGLFSKCCYCDDDWMTKDLLESKIRGLEAHNKRLSGVADFEIYSNQTDIIEINQKFNLLLDYLDVELVKEGAKFRKRRKS